MINACCFFFGTDSWSRHGRNFFAAWQKQEDVRLISWNEPEGHRHETIACTCDTPSANDPGIGLGPIERMETIVGAQRIAFVVWETTIMPADKVRILRSMDRVWTPSRWGRQLLIDNGLDSNK